MIGFTAFKCRKARQFEYKPRSFDPEKEALEERKRKVLGSRYQAKDAETDAESELRTIHFRRGLMADDTRKQRKKTNTVRLLIVLALMILAAYWLWIF